MAKTYDITIKGKLEFKSLEDVWKQMHLAMVALGPLEDLSFTVKEQPPEKQFNLPDYIPGLEKPTESNR